MSLKHTTIMHLEPVILQISHYTKKLLKSLFKNFTPDSEKNNFISIKVSL